MTSSIYRPRTLEKRSENAEAAGGDSDEDEEKSAKEFAEELGRIERYSSRKLKIFWGYGHQRWVCGVYTSWNITVT